jgi:hypothetical protein
LERGEAVAESVPLGQLLLLGRATEATNLERVLRRCFYADKADSSLSLGLGGGIRGSPDVSDKRVDRAKRVSGT